MKTIKTNTGNEVKIFAKTIEDVALKQIEELANSETYKDSTIRIMPDCHAGIGCTIGTTMSIKDKITPNLVLFLISLPYLGLLCIFKNLYKAVSLQYEKYYLSQGLR